MNYKKKLLTCKLENKKKFNRQNYIIGGLIICFLIILIYLIFVRVREYYQQLDPMLDKIKNNLLPLHTKVKHIKFYEGKRSYTINKQRIYICLKDENNEYYDLNMLMYVSIHELAHAICNEIGHTEKFYRIFKHLLQKAEKLNIYNPKIPIISNYCNY
jgi:CRISPR/Cas system CSM-associated protein Csm2 small subunit